MSTNALLALLGYTTSLGTPERVRIVLRAGVEVFRGDAHEVSDWLAATWRQRCGWAS